MKDAVFTDDTTAFMTYQLKPQMRTLGPKYGKLLGKAIGEKLQRWMATMWSLALKSGETVSL